MVETLISSMQGLIEQYNFWGVLAASFIEEVIAPLPSAVVMMFSAFTLVTGHVGGAAWFRLMGYVALPVAIGITLGSMVFYWLAFYAGKPLLVKYGKWVGLSWHALEKAEESFTKGYTDEIILFTVRAVPLVPNVAVNAFCGLVRFDFRKFVIFTFIGSFVRGLALGFVGWQFGEVYEKYAGYFARVEKITAVIVVLSIVGFYFYRKYGKHRRNKHSEIIVRQHTSQSKE